MSPVMSTIDWSALVEPAPACISVDMINADTNETICHATPVYGTGDEPLNEAGYAAGILPCIWGTKEEGLRAPPVLSLDTNITVVKRAICKLLGSEGA